MRTEDAFESTAEALYTAEARLVALKMEKQEADGEITTLTARNGASSNDSLAVAVALNYAACYSPCGL